MMGRIKLPEGSPFFVELKKWQPDKWKKAVKEFTKAIEKAGYGIPAISEERGAVELPSARSKGKVFGKNVSDYYHERRRELYPELWGERTPAKSLGEGAPEKEAHVWNIIRKEYDDFVRSRSREALYKHRQAVLDSGSGQEYFLTPRWEKWDGVSRLPEPKRTPDTHQTILPFEHPKVVQYLRMQELREKKRRAALLPHWW